MEKQNLFLKYAKTYFLEVHLSIMEVKTLWRLRDTVAVFFMVLISQILKKFMSISKKKKISFKVKNQHHLTNLLQKKLDKKNFSKKSVKNLSLEGIKILNKIFNEIC